MEDLLSRSSAMLFDLVSTGILQALLTDKPVFVFSDLAPLDDDALALLRRRAVVSPSPNEFAGSVAGFLRGDAVFPDSLAASHDFIRAFGLHEGDGNSSRRAVSILQAAVNRPPPRGEGKGAPVPSGDWNF